MTEVPIGPLCTFAETIWRSVGVPSDQATVLVNVCLEADLRGHHDHGCWLMGLFMADAREGKINVAPRAGVVTETPVSVIVDGDGGFGAIPATLAMGQCIQKARQGGIGLAVVRNSSHPFYPGYYAHLAIEAGLVGFFTTTSRPAIAPPGTRRRTLGQMPVAYGIPAGRHPSILLDVGHAASVAKIRQYARRGQALPNGWALDRDGRPTTDAEEALRASLLVPIGDHKGFGLALVMHALATGFTGAPVGSQAGAHGGVGHFMWALDPAVFGAGGEFADRVDTLIDDVKAADAREDVIYPGERGARTRAAALSRGSVTLPDTTVQVLADLARETGLSWPPTRD